MLKNSHYRWSLQSSDTYNILPIIHKGTISGDVGGLLGGQYGYIDDNNKY
ncbi:hypothetical protein C427_4309 [Paraglaciecola psychrophila 170]|uniref:Uncharacterized protein n=1 Tax=Paraglaciecola psychrophila 170 TaxID=1129794 RepID=K6Z008_9ALTE|nr:hypothetical protein C427_4309 [Paraglaciecola psychrophila 170]GAC38354.1 hypothetical protein GPSY_2742 [Paraglaciecola psychrophila 170]